MLQVLGRAAGTGCSRGGPSSDRNLNYVVTQALGSLGPSFTAQPDLLRPDLGSVSSRGSRPGLVSSPHPHPPSPNWGKGRGSWKGWRKGRFQKRGEVAGVPLPPCSLLPAGEGSWLGRRRRGSFQLPPSAPVYLRSGSPPRPQLSSELLFPPLTFRLRSLIQLRFAAVSLNLGSTLPLSSCSPRIGTPTPASDYAWNQAVTGVPTCPALPAHSVPFLLPGRSSCAFSPPSVCTQSPSCRLLFSNQL